MCTHCFEQKIYSFKTEVAFAVLSAMLTQKIASGQFITMGPASPKPPMTYDADECYECQSCQEFWLLATPDNAWRGFFLPAQDAVAYQQELRHRDKRIRVVSLLALILLSFVIWRFTR
jgi:hypothetical protein